MKKIDKIKIQNFQNHPDTTIDFAPGVNYITGPSDNGKTVVVRSIRWVAKNRPAGDQYIRKGTKECKVVLQEGRSRITRERNTKTNQYRLNRETYKAISLKVPEQISTALNMNDVNIQGQFDDFFLLQDTAGQVAQKFNKVMGLDVIDSTSKKVNSVVNAAKIREDFALEEVKRKTEELAAYDQLDAIQILVDGAVALQETIEKIHKRVDKTKRLMIEYELIEKQKDHFQELVKAAPQVEKAVKLQASIKTQQEKIYFTNHRLEECKRVKKTIDELTDWLSVEKEIPLIQTLVDTAEKADIRANKIEAHLAAVDIAEIEKQSILYRQEKAASNMVRYKEENPSCPTCEKVW
jgi:exonuclease SbcC